MKYILILFLAVTCILPSVYAQDEDEDIVFIIDLLRYKWDDEAEFLESFEGIEEYCHVKTYKLKVTELLTDIHHYDTTLYNTVTAKYKDSEDSEAKATLDDILLIESEYTTKKFLEFLDLECDKVKTIEKHRRKANNDVDAEMSRLEKELILYIDGVTKRIDLVNENIHHLRNL